MEMTTCTYGTFILMVMSNKIFYLLALSAHGRIGIYKGFV